MIKRLLYMVLDSETATLPFVNMLARGSSEIKKCIAIAKPLIYNIGWVICDRLGNIYEKREFLVSEIFSVPSVFNTAYYADKRPIYIEKLNRGEIVLLPWNEIMKIFIADMQKVNAVGAFNSMFDFKKAIPFTDLYIQKLYSNDYYKWEAFQYEMCEKIACGETFENKNDKNFDGEIFSFRGENYPLFDLWGLSVTALLNNVTYKKACLQYNMLTQSGTYFKSSVESTYRFLQEKYDFDEAHTALEDALIEAYILSRIAKKQAITLGIKFFPFRDLGLTYDFCQRTKKPNIKECGIVYKAIEDYIMTKLEAEQRSNYINGLINRLIELAEYMNIPCQWVQK